MKIDGYNNDYDHDGDIMIMMMVLLGQTCIAPDYIYCHEKVYDTFLLALKNKLNQVCIHTIYVYNFYMYECMPVYEYVCMCDCL